MIDLPKDLYLTQDIKLLEKYTIEKSPISAYQLMCLAGEAAFELLLSYWPNAKTLTIFCGPGNNGGDGFVLARLAKAKGMAVTVFQLKIEPEKKSPSEATQAREAFIQAGGKILDFENQPIISDVIVDALLGIGYRSPLPHAFQSAILAINQSKCPILAIDIPSGLNADTGSYDLAVKATVTITFMGMKLGLVSGNAVDVVGDLNFHSLGVQPEGVNEVKPSAQRLIYQEEIQALPSRYLSGNKGNYGHILIIGGGETGFSGAVSLAGEAALRAGAGLVSAVVRPESLGLLSRSPAELMCYGLEEPEQCLSLLNRSTVVVLGPGLGQNKWSEDFFKAALKTEKPLVVDADGLNHLARFPQKNNQWILTPHPGEAARLLGRKIDFIQQDRVNSALLLQEKYGGIIVLKGAGTVVVDETGSIAINAGGFPILSTGGTGDVLAGLIGGLLGQKIPLAKAAKIGVCVHTHAAQCEELLGDRGMIASDLFLHIRSLLNPTSTK